MKKSTISRIFLLILSLALMITAIFSVSASAEGEKDVESLEIISQNVSYEGQTHLFYAVSYENVATPEAITLEVKWTDSEGEHTTTVTESAAEEVEGKDCRTFKTPGVDAKNFTQNFTVVAKTENGTVSAPKTFSVAEYCNLWITYIAYTSATGTPTEEDIDFSKACEATLKYGSAIQKHLKYYPAGNTADHPENYAYVKAFDGTVNGGASAHVVKGSEVALAYTGALEGDKAVTAWNVYYADGTTDTVDASGVFAPKANCVAEAVVESKFVPASGYYYSNTRLSNSIYRDYSAAKQLNKMESSLIPGFSAADQTTASATVSIVDGQLVFDKKDDAVGYEEYIFWSLTTTPSDYDTVVFETDIKFSGISTESGIFAEYSLRNKTGIWHKISFSASNGKFSIGNVGEFNFDEWYNVRFVSVINSADSTVVVGVYVNNRYIGDAKCSVVNNNDKNTGKAHIYLSADETGSVTLDNLFFGYHQEVNVGGTYYNDTENYAGLTRYDYENGVAQSVDKNNGAAATAIEGGASKFFKVIGENAVAKSDNVSFAISSEDMAESNTFVFETDIRVNGNWSTKPKIWASVFGYDIELTTDCWPYNELHFPYKGAVVAVENWYNLRFEFAKTETAGSFTLTVYLNGVSKLTQTVSGSATSSTSFLIEMPAGQSKEAIMYFDNVAYGYINK